MAHIKIEFSEDNVSCAIHQMTAPRLLLAGIMCLEHYVNASRQAAEKAKDGADLSQIGAAFLTEVLCKVNALSPNEKDKCDPTTDESKQD